MSVDTFGQGWTIVFDVLQCFGWKARQSRCNDLHATKDVRYMTQLTRPIQHLRSLGPSKRLNCGTRLWVRVCVETAFN